MIEFEKDTILKKRYKIDKLIGHGGTALIYLAQDLAAEDNNLVAIKIARSDAKVSSGLERFRNEAKLLDRFNNQNIIKVLDYLKTDDYEAMVIEYIDGQTLKQIINSKGVVSIEDSVFYTQQILKALGEIHSKKIFHRDLKPQNIMVSFTNQVKILDFGIAKHGDVKDGVTKTGKVVGSVQYLAPEVLKGDNASIASDIYATGMILYELLAGEAAYKGDKPAVVAGRVVNEELPDIKKINTNVDQNLSYIIKKSLNKNPSQRYQSTKEFILDLDKYQNKQETYAQTEMINVINNRGRYETEQFQLYKKSRRNFFIFGSIALFIICAIIITFIILLVK